MQAIRAGFFLIKSYRWEWAFGPVRFRLSKYKSSDTFGCCGVKPWPQRWRLPSFSSGTLSLSISLSSPASSSPLLNAFFLYEIRCSRVLRAYAIPKPFSKLSIDFLRAPSYSLRPERFEFPWCLNSLFSICLNSVFDSGLWLEISSRPNERNPTFMGLSKFLVEQTRLWLG